jgi:pantothenate synthetase
VLHRALQAGAAAVAAGERDPAAVTDSSAPSCPPSRSGARVGDFVDVSTLTTPPVLAGELRLLVAARAGRARLIDNVGVRA